LADLQESNPELASEVHVFSSFFYKKLSTKMCVECFVFQSILTHSTFRSPEEGFNSVRKWTSKFDLFQKKYIIVPINEKYVVLNPGWRDRFLMDYSLHWYLAIICFPGHTLLPRPIQDTGHDQLRRSTRHLGVVIDLPDALQPDPASRQLLLHDPDPPPNGQVDTVSCSEPIDPETPKTDDQKDEIDVERMVESGLVRVEPTAEQADGQQQVGTPSPDTLVTQCPDSPTLVYPHSSPPSHPTTLPITGPQGEDAGQLNHPTSSEAGEGDTIRTSGIPPSTFYGRKSQGQGDVIAQAAPINNNSLPEIEIDEDETMGNPESEPEEAAECVSFVFRLLKLSLMSIKASENLHLHL